MNSLVSYLDRMIMIDPDSPVPPYRQLAAILRGRIAAGELAGRLPGETTLMQESGLAHATIRKALKVLREEDLIETVPGWGSYVRDPGPDPPSTASGS